MKSSDSKNHPFGGCNRLLGHYKTVGDSLLAYEADYGGFKSVFRLNTFKGRSEGTREFGALFSSASVAFRENVSFVPVEVLESYLEDLLNLEIADERLYITHSASMLPGYWIAVGGFCAAACAGLVAAACGLSPLFSGILVLLLSTPFILLWNIVPHSKLARRVAFAKLVSREASRRRGSDGSGISKRLDSQIIKRLLPTAPAESAKGAAFKICH